MSGFTLSNISVTSWKCSVDTGLAFHLVEQGRIRIGCSHQVDLRVLGKRLEHGPDVIVHQTCHCGAVLLSQWASSS